MTLRPCGTNAAYARGCRCDACRAAHTAHGRAYGRTQPTYWRRANVKRYGITLEQFDALLAAQKYRCACCGTKKPGAKGWHIDHDHDTGQVRGILCGSCNGGLGLFNDSPKRLRAALHYVQTGVARTAKRLKNAKVKLRAVLPSRAVTFRGETRTISDWARVTGISFAALYSRLRDNGWPVRRALTTPTRIIDKLGKKNRAGAAAEAVRRGIIP